jgi:hypothetical protein
MPPNSGKATRRVVVALSAYAVIALTHSGCAPAPSPEAQPAAAVAPARAETQEIPRCRVDAALLRPQSPPDCAFGRPDLKTLDPDQWARLKVESERQCYQRAESAVRERLQLLQAANRCGAMARADNPQ